MLIQNFQVLRENKDKTYTIMSDINTSLGFDMKIILNPSEYVRIDDTIYYVIDINELEESYNDALTNYELGYKDYIGSYETSQEMWEEFLEEATELLKEPECFLSYFHHEVG